MKKLLVLFLGILLLSPAVYAETVRSSGESHGAHTVTVHDHDDVHTTVGIKFDAPHLVGIPQISDNLFLGIEGGKDWMTDPFRPSTRSYVEDDRGYFAYLKLTYNGCLINCNQ